MNPFDLTLLSLCLWREARGEGKPGMIAVGCVVRNRVKARQSTFYTEVVRHLQFSSISAPGDPQLANWPAPDNPDWSAAVSIASSVIGGTQADTTGNATVYYAFNSIPFPKNWDATKLVQTVDIGNHRFYREIA